MACDTWRKTPEQTLRERIDQIRERMKAIELGLGRNKFGVKVGPQGAVTFTGLSAEDRAGMSDACVLRRILSPSGSALARARIEAAERIAGRKVDRQQVAAGIHSHDGGETWGSH